jgi:DNA primase
MTDPVQQIKERLNIIDVISAYTELHKAGRQFKAKCPFHNEKTPSFNVSPERGMYHCYGCGVGGDMFTFIQAIEGVDFKEALKILAEKANVELVPVSREKQSERDRLYATLEAATVFYTESLKKHPPALAYIEARGVSTQTMASWRLGFAPGPPESSWRATKEALATQKYTAADLLKVGLIKGSDEGKEPYDVFRNRVMFPLFDQSGRVVAFSGRTLEKGDGIPKYVNSPETELFKKSEILYGYDRAKHGIRQLDFSLIVEGQFDVVMSHQAGYTNTVAVSGTAFTLQHVQLLERISKKVVLALDADKAGINAAKRSADLMLRRGLDVKVAMMPEGMDPADMILRDPKEFKRVIGSSVHVIEFLLAHLKSQGLDARTLKLRAREEVIPYVPLLPNRIDQDHFEGLIAAALETTKEAVHFEVERAAERLEASATTPAYKVTAPEEKKTPEEGNDVSQRRTSVIAYILGAIHLFDETVAKRLEAELLTVTEATLTELETLVPLPKRAEVIMKAETFVAEQPRRLFDAEVLHAFNQLRELTIRQALQAKKGELRQAEEQGDEPAQTTLLSEVMALQRKLQIKPYTAESLFKSSE